MSLAPSRRPPSVSGAEPTAEASREPAQAATVDCLRDALQPADHVRWVRESQDLLLPAVPFPPRQVVEASGAPRLRALVRRQHELLLASPAASLFPAEPAAFHQLTERIADFVVEACGGAPGYTEVHGHGCLRTRHFPVTIDEAAREHWLAALWQAIDDVGVPTEVRADLWQWLEAMSVRMVNRRTQREQPMRYSYEQMQSGGTTLRPSAAAVEALQAPLTAARATRSS